MRGWFRLRELSRPANRRLGMVSRRRLLCTATLLVLCPLVPGTVALADPPVGQIVSATIYTSHGTSADSVSLSALLSNPQRCPPYSGQSMTEYRQPPLSPIDVGFPPNIGPDQGTWTLSTILDCMETPIQVGAATAITVLGIDGSPEVSPYSELTPTDLITPSDFQNEQQVPVIAVSGSTIEYDRPWRGAQDDYNFDDQVTEPTGAPISIEVFEGPTFTVTIDESRPTVAAGGSVQFSATVTGSPSGRLAYSWEFNGGAPDSTAATPDVTFTDPGVYDVGLQVTDSSGGTGSASLVPVMVTSASGQPPSGSGSTTEPGGGISTTPNAPPTGPQNGTGTTPNGTTPSSNDDGPSASQTRRGRRRARSAVASGKSHRRGSGGVRASTAGPTGGSTSAASPASTEQPHTAATPVSATRTSTLIRTSTPGSSALTSVSGRLIGDLALLPVAASPLAHDEPASLATEPLRRAIRTSFMPLVVGLLVVFLLLGLGAGRELRGRRTLRFGS